MFRDIKFYLGVHNMQAGRPSQLTAYAKEIRIAQLKEQIKILEQQLDNAKRDLKRLEKST